MDTHTNPPTPQAGGSYLVDEQTGEFVLVERTRERGETAPAAVAPVPSVPTPEL